MACTEATNQLSITEATTQLPLAEATTLVTQGTSMVTKYFSSHTLGQLVFGLYTRLVLAMQVLALLHLFPKLTLPAYVLTFIRQSLNALDYLNIFAS